VRTLIRLTMVSSAPPLNQQSPPRDDSGVGLIEIVVSMFLLALLAISFLPVLVQGLQQAALNSTRATAVQLANEQVELARGTTATCANLEPLGTVPVANFIDAQGVTIQVTRTISACPSTYPGTMQLTVRANRVDTGHQLSELITLLYVSAAS
jgi:type II secretory pathway pseudopilin PulG